MSDEPDNLVLRYLRRIDERVERLGADFVQIRPEMATMRNDMSLIYHRLDRVEFRLDRIEKRLDLAPA